MWRFSFIPMLSALFATAQTTTLVMDPKAKTASAPMTSAITSLVSSGATRPSSTDATTTTLQLYLTTLAPAISTLETIPPSSTAAPPFTATALTSYTTDPPFLTTTLTSSTTPQPHTTDLTTYTTDPSFLTTTLTSTTTPAPYSTALTSYTTDPPFLTTTLTSSTTPQPHTTDLTTYTTDPSFLTTTLTSTTTPAPYSTALTSYTTDPPFLTTTLTSTTTPAPYATDQTSYTTDPPFLTTTLTSTTTPASYATDLTSYTTNPPFLTTTLTSTTTPAPYATDLTSYTTDPPFLTTTLTSTTTPAPYATDLTSYTTDPPFTTTALTSTTTPQPLTTTLTSTTTSPLYTTALTSYTTDPPLPTTTLTHTTTPQPYTTVQPSYTTDPPFLTTALTSTTTPQLLSTAVTSKTTTPPTPTAALTSKTTTPPTPTTALNRNITTPPSSTSAWTTSIPTNGTDPASNTTTASTTSTFTTTTPTTTTIPTTQPLKCVNDGELEDGVCICPDEWTGVNCSILNYCSSSPLDGFTFPKTVIGWSAYSSETCPPDTTNAGIPIASTRCLENKDGPKFDRIQIIECQITFENIQANVSDSISAEEAQKFASSTQILTSKPEQLTADNITSAAGIVNTILSNSANITEETAVAAVATISQLLTANPQEFTEPNEATLGLTETLENFTVNPNNNVSLVVQPRLVIQSTQVSPAQTAGIQFSALRGQTNNFTANRIQLHTNVSEILNTSTPSNVQIFIRFPTDRLPKNSNVSVGFVVYENDLLFRSKTFRPTLNSRRMVISGTLGGVKAEHVTLRFMPMNVDNKTLHDFACVFWDYGTEDWNTFGCSKASLSKDTLQCRCNHTTNFAVLMSFRENHKYAKSLNVISIVGCSLSILGLILTILFQISTRKSRKTAPTVLMISICVCMTIFYILFLSGINNPSKDRNKTLSEENRIPSSDLYQEPDDGLCTAFTALMQYFLLATFTWNTLYALHIFVLIKATFSVLPQGFLVRSIAIGWGLPAVVVAVTLGMTYRVDNPLGYRREDFCWLAALNQDGNFDFGKPLFWGFLLPVSIMLLLNTAVLIYFGIATCKKNPKLTSTKSTSLKKKFMSSFSLGTILGLTWVLGYLVLSTEADASYIFSIFFCVCNTTQGLQIFILFTVRTAHFRKTFLSVTNSVSAPEIAIHRKRYSLWRIKKPKKTGSKDTSRSADDGTFSQRDSDSRI